MSKITFISESALTKVTFETQNLSLHRILEDFEQFLRGAGFCFDGHLELVEEDLLPEEEST